MVTVALELWQSNCKTTTPTRGGVVRLRAEAIRVSEAVPVSSGIAPYRPDFFSRIEFSCGSNASNPQNARKSAILRPSFSRHSQSKVAFPAAFECPQSDLRFPRF